MDDYEEQREIVRPATSRLDSLKARLAATESEKVEAEKAIAPEEREEIELRRSIVRAEEERDKARRDKAELQLERELELAIEQHPKLRLTTLLIDDYLDRFVLRANHKAAEVWQDKIARSAHNKKIDRSLAGRVYALSSIVMWNGTDLSDPLSSGGDLAQHLKNNCGLVTSIIGAAWELTGASSEARKS